MNAIASHLSARGWKFRPSLGAALVAASAGLALLAGSSPVLAGTSNLDVVVESALTPPPLPDVVSPSASTCTFPTLVKGCTIAAYSVAISNPTSSNVSNAWFKATTYVFDTTGAQTSIKAQFLTVPSNCTKSPDSTTISCSIGQVAAGGGSFPKFVVTVHSPSVTAKGYEIRFGMGRPVGTRREWLALTGEFVDGHTWRGRHASWRPADSDEGDHQKLGDGAQHRAIHRRHRHRDRIEPRDREGQASQSAEHKRCDAHE